MHDTLANNWRQRMAGRSALCAVLLAVPVAVAAQISFSGGLGGVPFGVEALTDGPGAESIGTAPAPAQDQNLTRLLSGDSAAALAAGAQGDGSQSTGDGGGQILSGSTPETVQDPVGGVDPPAATDPLGGGGTDPADPPSGPPPGSAPTPPADPGPQPSPPSASAIDTTPAPDPVPDVAVPDPGGVVGGVTQPLENAANGILNGG